METTEQFDIGDKVKHPKFGNGTIMYRTGSGDGQKLLIKFGGEVGEKKIVAKFAKMKKIQERPTLPAAPAEGEAVPAEAKEE